MCNKKVLLFKKIEKYPVLCNKKRHRIFEWFCGSGGLIFQRGEIPDQTNLQCHEAAPPTTLPPAFARSCSADGEGNPLSESLKVITPKIWLILTDMDKRQKKIRGIIFLVFLAGTFLTMIYFDHRAVSKGFYAFNSNNIRGEIAQMEMARSRIIIRFEREWSAILFTPGNPVAPKDGFL